MKNLNLKKNKTLKYIYTFKYVKLVSYLSARYLQTQRNESHKQKYVYYYGFQVLYGTINKFLLLFLAGLILHILPQIAIVTLSFISLRVFIGGLHFESYTKCAWISLLTLIGMSLLSKYLPYHSLTNLIIFLTIIIIAFLYAPVEHKNRPLTDSKKIKFKVISLMIISILLTIQLIMNNENINNSIMYGVMLSGIISLPILKNLK